MFCVLLNQQFNVQFRWTGCLWVLLLFFVPVSRNAMEVFLCDDYGQTFWLASDPSTKCYTTPYWAAVAVASLILLLFTVAAPVVAVCKVRNVVVRGRKGCWGSGVLDGHLGVVVVTCGDWELDICAFVDSH